MTRRDELLALFSDKDVLTIVTPLIDELCFIEEQIEELKKEPMIRYHPKNRAIQKLTLSGRLYKELLSKKTELTKTLYSMARKSAEGGETSPLREYLELVKQK